MEEKITFMFKQTDDGKATLQTNANVLDIMSCIANIIHECYNKVIKDKDQKEMFKRNIKDIIENDLVFAKEDEITEKAKEILIKKFAQHLDEVYNKIKPKTEDDNWLDRMLNKLNDELNDNKGDA